MVVLPLYICPNYFFVAGLSAKKRPTSASCALSDMWEVRAQNQILSERARNGVLDAILWNALKLED